MFKFIAFVFFAVLVSFSALATMPKNRLEFVPGSTLEDYDCPEGYEAQKEVIKNSSGQDKFWVVCQTKTQTLPSDVEDLATRPFKKTLWHKSELNSMQRDLIVLTVGLTLLAVAFAISLSSLLGLILGYFLTLILSSAYGFNQDYLGYVGLLLFLILLIFSKAFQMILSRIKIIQVAEAWIKGDKNEKKAKVEKPENDKAEKPAPVPALTSPLVVVNHNLNGGISAPSAESAAKGEDKKKEEGEHKDENKAAQPPAAAEAKHK